MMHSSDPFDLVVVGGGVFGLGTALEAGRRGRRTLLLERGPIPNPVAASYGPSRKIRSTYTDPLYAGLAREAMAAWRGLERETGRELMVASGNLVYTMLDDQPRLDELRTVAETIGSPIEQLDGSRLGARFPQFRGARRALLETEAGFLRASACVATLRELAEQAGVVVATEQEVTGLHPAVDGVAVETAGGETYRGEQAVVALGGWSKRLLPELEATLVQSQQGLYYLSGVPAAYSFPTFPAFSCADNGFYGFPAHGGDSMKVAQHILGEPIGSPDFDRATTPPGFVEAAREFLRDGLGLDPDTYSARAESCMYNLPPSGDFLLDVHPDHPRLFVATGGSGHGFKFGSVIGALILDRLDGKESGRWSPQLSWSVVTGSPVLARPR